MTKAIEPLTGERLNEMLRGLEGVTPGPWDTSQGLIRSIDGDEAIPIFETRAPWKKHRRIATVAKQEWHNGHHIARCDPDTMRSILTELRSLRTLSAAHGEAVACMAAIDELRREEGDQVSILCDNPDFNGQPNNAIVISAGWTNWQDFRVSGHTLRGALENAVAIKAMAPADRPVPMPSEALDDDAIMEIIRECFPWQSEGQILGLLVREKSSPMFPQATYDVPNYRAERFVRAVEARIAALKPIEPATIPGYAFCLQGRDGSGYRVRYGFESMEQGHAFHDAVIAIQKNARPELPVVGSSVSHRFTGLTGKMVELSTDGAMATVQWDQGRISDPFSIEVSELRVTRSAASTPSVPERISEEMVARLALEISEAVMGNPIVEQTFAPGDERNGFKSDIQIEAVRVLRAALNGAVTMTKPDDIGQDTIDAVVSLERKYGDGHHSFELRDGIFALILAAKAEAVKLQGLRFRMTDEEPLTE